MASSKWIYLPFLGLIVAGCAAPPAPPPKQAEKIVEEPIDFSKRARLEDGPEGARLIFPDGLLFDTNVANLTSEASKNVDVCQFIIEKARGTIVVEGHTDATGVRARNEELSRRRAETVRAALIERKVAPTRIEVRALAATKPVVPNASTSEELAQNRRAEIIFRGETVASLNAPYGCGAPPVRRTVMVDVIPPPVVNEPSAMERLGQDIKKATSKILGD
jgi:outer membrane protein OmpA-like peptidoglycan-associated protein